MYQSTVGEIPIAIILVTLKGCWNIQGSGAGYNPTCFQSGSQTLAEH
jgi:hypothetical protein